MRLRSWKCLGVVLALCGPPALGSASSGLEVGLEPELVWGLRTRVSLWWVDADSALSSLAGEEGVEASRAARSYGVELEGAYASAEWLELEGRAALTRARLLDDDPAQDFVADSPRAMISAGVTLGKPDGPFAALRASYFDRAPLLFAAQIGWRFGEDWTLMVEALDVAGRSEGSAAFLHPALARGDDGAASEIRFQPLSAAPLRVSFDARF